MHWWIGSNQYGLLLVFAILKAVFVIQSVAQVVNQPTTALRTTVIRTFSPVSTTVPILPNTRIATRPLPKATTVPRPPPKATAVPRPPPIITAREGMSCTVQLCERGLVCLIGRCVRLPTVPEGTLITSDRSQNQPIPVSDQFPNSSAKAFVLNGVVESANVIVAPPTVGKVQTTLPTSNLGKSLSGQHAILTSISSTMFILFMYAIVL